MSSPVLAHDVFIASPGGLTEERAAVRREIAEFNEERMVDTGHAFVARGWEDVAGALGRAQAVLNEELRRSDYLVLILADRWGTPPGSPAEYTSGTEEEYQLARTLAEDADAPMRDILLLFRGLADDRLRDPGPQLQKVLKFKTEREEAHDVYYKTFDNIEDLRREIRRALQKWACGAEVSEQQTRGRDGSPTATTIHEAREAPPVGVPLAGLLELARDYEERGLITQAEALYAQAVADEDVDALAAYARFLRRTGRPIRSITVNERLLSQLTIQTARDTSGERSQILTNIGIARRKLGELAASRQRLQESIATARSGNPPDQRALAYALDNLAITMMRMGDLDDAGQVFEEARSLRDDPLFSSEERAESVLNIARLLKRRGRLQESEDEALRALTLLPNESPHRLRAASLLLAGQLQLARRDFRSAAGGLREALAINEALGAPDYIAMCAHQLALATLGLGDIAEAEKYAERSLRENRDASNREGELTALVLLSRVLLSGNRAKEALPLLHEAAKGLAGSPNRTARGWALKYLSDAQSQLGMDAEATATRERAAQLGIS